MKRKNKLNNRVLSRVLIAFIFAFLLYALFSFLYNDLYSIRYKKKKLKENFLIANSGMIISCGKRVRTYNGYAIQFRYKIDDIDYEKRQYESFDFKSGYKYSLLSKNLPVIYDRLDHSNAFILISPDDFEYFEIPFPDSLQWIKENVLR